MKNRKKTSTPAIDSLSAADLRSIQRELGRRAGRMGGKARAKKLTAEQRRAIAKLGAQARWKKKAQP